MGRSVAGSLLLPVVPYLHGPRKKCLVSLLPAEKIDSFRWKGQGTQALSPAFQPERPSVRAGTGSPHNALSAGKDRKYQECWK